MTEAAITPPLSPALTMVVQARMVEQRIEAGLAPLGLSMRKFGVLGHLRATPGLSFSALARRAGIKVQSLHPIIDALTGEGYVRTVGEVSQGRAATLELTDEGVEAVESGSRLLAEVDQSVFSAGEWAVLGEALNGIAVAYLRRGGVGQQPGT